MKNNVLIALPAKDKEKKLGPVLGRIRRYFPGVDILIIDDGSSDRTAEIALEKGILLFKHDRNYGYARALQSAREFALSRGYE
jgi:glycosyltransferase involved in cell wall biosynthesis